MKNSVSSNSKSSVENEQLCPQLDSIQVSQYLTFIVDSEEYGVDILMVQEIRGWENTTAIPNGPRCIKGVINLRGNIVPIIDLRVRFGLKEKVYGPLTVVIVLKIKTEKGSRTMGIVVDAVSDVHIISQKDIRDTPDFGDNRGTSFLQGLVNVDEKMIVLLDVDKLLGIEGLKMLS